MTTETPPKPDQEIQTQTPETAAPAAENIGGNGEYVVIEAYEQLKRKNRRRLVAAGALVLVAGGLFTAASQKSPPAAPALSTQAVERAPVVTTDILLPGDGRTSASSVNVDDSQNAPIKMSRKIQAAAPLSPEEKAALEARQQRAKAQRLAQQRKLEAERAEREGKNGNTVAALKEKDTVKPQKTAAERSKEREEEQRRKKAQAMSAKAEAERKAKESSTADKARAAQVAADKQRASDRAKLEKENPKKVQQTADKTKTADKTRGKARTEERGKPAEKSVAKSSIPNGRVTIQAGAFSDKAHAQRVQQQLKGFNYSSHLEEVQTAKGTVYRVRTGKFANQNEAKNALERIKGKGMNGVVVVSGQ